MSQKNGMQNKSEVLVNDVERIREILFGEQAKNIEVRIEEIEAELSHLREENTVLKQALSAEEKAREKIEGKVNGRFTDIREDLRKVKWSTTRLTNQTKEWREEITEEREEQNKEIAQLVDAIIAHLQTQSQTQSEHNETMIAMLKSDNENQQNLLETFTNSVAYVSELHAPDKQPVPSDA